MKTIALYLIIVVPLMLLQDAYVKYRKKKRCQEFEYERKYRFIKNAIEKYEVCQINYDYLMIILTHLCNLPHKNREKSSVLRNRFFERFGEFVEKDVKLELKKAI
jgi:hypothetical protein